MKTYSQSELKELSEYKVNRVKKIFKRYLCHVKGRWQGVPFTLIPWQEAAIEKIFGTLKPNGLRQYRFVYIEIPKKNGKSEFCSGLGIVGLIGDDEPGAEVYCAAGDRGQAAIVFDSAAFMVNNKKTLKSRIKVKDSIKRMIYHQNASIMQVLSSEVHTKHGYNPSMVIFDELHAQPNRDLYDVLTDGTDAARQQQLVIIITTAGIYDKEHIAWETHDYSMKVANGEIDDPTWLSIIYGINDDADENGQQIESPDDPEVWRRVNPSIGHIMDFENLETNYKQSRNNPVKWNKFRRLRINEWVGQIDRFIVMHHWDLCQGPKIDKQKLIGKPCFGGLDLASSQDLTAFILVFPPMTDNDDRFTILCRFYVPEETIKERIPKEVALYEKWIKSSYLTPTIGNRMNWQHIRTDIENDSQLYDIREIAYDRWGAMQIAMDLSQNLGIEMVQHGQGFADMSAPTKKLNEMVLGHELIHNGHPVLRWNADNLAVETDAAENFKPTKKKSRDRIDGIVALIMAVGRTLANPDLKSVYDERGIRFL